MGQPVTINSQIEGPLSQDLTVSLSEKKGDYTHFGEGIDNVSRVKYSNNTPKPVIKPKTISTSQNFQHVSNSSKNPNA